MTLKEALHGISAPKYFDICGYSYRSLFMYGDYQYKDLPKDFQDGIMVLACKVYELSEMVYSYDIELFTKYMKRIGIKRKTFYNECDINQSFYQTLGLNVNRDERLIAIKLQCYKILIRLFKYMNHSKHS